MVLFLVERKRRNVSRFTREQNEARRSVEFFIFMIFHFQLILRLDLLLRCCTTFSILHPNLDALHSILIILHFVSLLVSPLILHSSTLSSRLCAAARTFASHCRLNSSFNLDKEKQSQNNVGVIIVVVSARFSLLKVAWDEGGSEAALTRVSSYLSRLCVKLRKSSALRQQMRLGVRLKL